MKMLIRTLMATVLICFLTAAAFAQDNPPKTGGARASLTSFFITA